MPVEIANLYTSSQGPGQQKSNTPFTLVNLFYGLLFNPVYFAVSFFFFFFSNATFFFSNFFENGIFEGFPFVEASFFI